MSYATTPIILPIQIAHEVGLEINIALMGYKSNMVAVHMTVNKIDLILIIILVKLQPD